MMGYSWHVNVSCDQYAFTAGFTVSSNILSHAKASFDRSFVVSLACLGMPYHDTTAVYRELNVFCAAVRKTLPCMQQFPPRRRSEWGSLEWKCHVANCDNGFCTGNSCPSPGSATQDGHLQRACQRAAANMVADNWWGEEAWSGWPSPNPTEINLQELDKQNAHTCVHVCAPANGVYVGTLSFTYPLCIL